MPWTSFLNSLAGGMVGWSGLLGLFLPVLWDFHLYLRSQTQPSFPWEVRPSISPTSFTFVSLMPMTEEDMWCGDRAIGYAQIKSHWWERQSVHRGHNALFSGPTRFPSNCSMINYYNQFNWYLWIPKQDIWYHQHKFLDISIQRLGMRRQAINWDCPYTFSVCMCVGGGSTHMPWHTCGSQRTSAVSRFFHFEPGSFLFCHCVVDSRLPGPRASWGVSCLHFPSC